MLQPSTINVTDKKSQSVLNLRTLTDKSEDKAENNGPYCEAGAPNVAVVDNRQSQKQEDDDFHGSAVVKMVKKKECIQLVQRTLWPLWR